MKTITKQYQLFTLDELKPEARARAIEDHRHDNTECDPYWYQVEEWNLRDRLEALGYTNVEMLFSGFGSQGDGACFTAGVDFTKYLEAHKELAAKCPILKDHAESVTVKITHRARYYYATSTTVDVRYDEEETDAITAELVEVENAIRAERETEGNRVYRILEDLYFVLINDDTIAEHLNEAEYTFLENGETFLG